MSLEDELAELRDAYEEFKASSAAIEEDLEQEVAKLEQENESIARKLQLAEESLDRTTRKAEQARELANRQVLTLEKQVQAMELSMKVMTEDRRRMEQENDSVERLTRQLEDQYESLEEIVEREAILRSSMEDLEFKFHREKLEHMGLMTKLKAAFKILYLQLKSLKQTPSVTMPDATPEEQASMDAAMELPAPDAMRASMQNEEAELNAKLQEQLASAWAQLDQAQRRVRELEVELQRTRNLTVASEENPAAATGSSSEGGTEEGKTPKFMSEGYLHKRGDGALSTWKRQLFKINCESHALESFFLQVSKVTTKRIKLGDIPLSGANIAIAQKDDKPNVFIIQPRFSKKTFYLQAQNADERLAWMNALQLETEEAAKRVAGSVRQDWVPVSFDQVSFEPMYCVVSKRDLQFFCAEDDEKPSRRYELDETVEVETLSQTVSERPALSLKFGAAVAVECLYIGFNVAEKRDTWYELVKEFCSGPQLAREDSEQNDDTDAADFPFCDMLSLFDPNRKQWDQFWFQVSADANFLDYYPDQKSAETGEPLGRLALVGAVQNVTSTAIVSNYPAGAYIEHEHIFGLTPPFSSLTRLIQCSSEENLLQWMDGLVTLLDSKVARDPYSTKEGYLYKQGVKATSKWRKKYIVLGLPDLKYYKAARQTRAVILTLTPESQVILRPSVKKFVYTFTLQESPGSREFLWGSKSQAEGEAWVSAIQACITKLRQRQPNPTTFNIPKLRATAARRAASREPTNRNGTLRVREISPSAYVHTRKNSGDYNQPKLVARRALRKNTNPEDPDTAAREEAEAVRELSHKSAALAFGIAQTRRMTSPSSTTTNLSSPTASSPAPTGTNTSSPNTSLSPAPTLPTLEIASPSTPTELTHLSITTSPSPSASLALPLSSSPVSAFSFAPRDSTNVSSPSSASASQPIATAKRGVLLVLKTSRFSRNERWASMIFELQANDRILNYYEQGTSKLSQCSEPGCTGEAFARFDGLCAHHHRTKGRKDDDSPSHRDKKKSFTWNLVKAQIESHVANQYPGHEFTFGLTGTGGPPLVVAAHDEKERTEWLVLLRARIYARFMFQSSSYEGLMGQLMPGGEWKEKYYVVRLGCLECYNRTDHKRAWSHVVTPATKVRTEDLVIATGKVGPTAGLARSMSNVGRNGGLRSSSSFLKGKTSNNASHLVDFLAAANTQSSEGKTLCENNSDRVIHPKGVFIVDLGAEKLVFGAESPAERDLWVAALDACIKEAQATAEDQDHDSEEDDESKRSTTGTSRRTQSLGDHESCPPKVQISVQNPPTVSAGGQEDLPSHLTWWANRGSKTATLPAPTISSSVPSTTSSTPPSGIRPSRGFLKEQSVASSFPSVLPSQSSSSHGKTPPPPPSTKSSST